MGLKKVHRFRDDLSDAKWRWQADEVLFLSSTTL